MRRAEENHLTQVIGEAVTTYRYNGDGGRVTLTTGCTTTVYIGNYFEWTGSTATMTSYYYAGGTRVAMRTGTPITGTVSYLVGDHLGSSSVSYRSDGGQTATQRYYPWGTIRPGPDNALPTDYGFTGQKLDVSAGLMYYGARYYDAALGRFIQPDTIVPEPGNPQSLNRYSYVLNNALKYTDPTGHAQICADGDLGGGCGYEWNVYTHWLVGNPLFGMDEQIINAGERGQASTAATIAATQQALAGLASAPTFDLWWQTTMKVKPGDSYFDVHSVSYGVSATGGVGAAGTVGVQVLGVDGDGNITVLALQRGGMGIAGGVASGTVWQQRTNAPTIDYPLNGVTVFAGGSAALGIGLGVDIVTVGRDPAGGYRGGLQGSIEFGAAGDPLTVAEFHGGAYYTGSPAVRLNVYDLAGFTRPSRR